MEQTIYSVIEITRHIKLMFEKNLPSLSIEGEISNFKPHYSGHAYFSLKDEHAQIAAVMWRSSVEKSGFDFKDGKKVICHGQVTVYEKTGRYQVIVNRIEEAGIGDLHQKFEKLKKKLAAKGYFDQDRKKRIPMYPNRIGIVTSPTGAAIQDMISIAQRRNSSVELIIRPAKVQGNDAYLDVAQGIRDLNDYKDIDVIVIGRGGGSLEDLWAFNEEVVADAIIDSKIPIVSAVGHEIDFSISDFVADRRAPTPSAAMEILIPDMTEMIGQLQYFKDKSVQLILNKIEMHKSRLESIKNHYALKKAENIIVMKNQRIEEIQNRIQYLVKDILLKKATRFISIKRQLNALGPQQVLERGYSIIIQDGKIIDESKKLEEGEIQIKFKDKTVDRIIRK